MARGGRGGGGSERDRVDSQDRFGSDAKGQAKAGGGGPTKNQLRGLSYIAPKTPAFLSAFKTQLAGGGGGSASGDPFDPLPRGGGGGRAPLPGGERQTSEEREAEARDQERDDDVWGFGEGDEAPSVVVLKEGRHLSQADLEDERRASKGLPPLQRKATPDATSSSTSTLTAGKTDSKPGGIASGPKSTKRKAVAVGGDAPAASAAAGSGKKAKKEKKPKGALSFNEEEDE